MVTSANRVKILF